MGVGKCHSLLGISAFYHNSAAVLLVDGKIVAAAEEERFTRVKHDNSFPEQAIAYVLRAGGLKPSELSAVVFYEKPLLKFERVLDMYHWFAPRGLGQFVSAMKIWLRQTLHFRRVLQKNLERVEGASLRGRMPLLLFPEHHVSHAASAFYPAPFEEAAVLTVDGVGEWTTTLIAYGEGKDITILREIQFPHSLGLLYSAFTYYCGFKVNGGEQKLMGLAPYGQSGSARVLSYKEKILTHLLNLKADGSFFMNPDYFAFVTKPQMTHDEKWEKLFGLPRRRPESELTQEYKDLALAIQEVTEEVMLRLAKTAKKLTGSTNLVLAGGVALNCVANTKILEAGIFENIWVQPAAGDAGGALGAALAAWHIYFGCERRVTSGEDGMQSAYLGPRFQDADIEKLKAVGAVFEKLSEEVFFERVAGHLSDGAVVGWFQGRMEWGPRALGNRSILADARLPGMQTTLNEKIKRRETFRPFAPSVLQDDVGKFFEREDSSPYMLFTNLVWKEKQSEIPAVTHVDGSARVHSVSQKANPKFFHLLEAFKKKTGCGLLVNTSFNVRGEPIVLTPADAYRCFMMTDLDYLVIENFIFDKRRQNSYPEMFPPQTYAD